VFSPFRARINRVSMTQGAALGWHVSAPFGANSNSRKRDIWAREPGPSAFRHRFSARTA
jgi:hypothetical protein